MYLCKYYNSFCDNICNNQENPKKECTLPGSSCYSCPYFEPFTSDEKEGFISDEKEERNSNYVLLEDELKEALLEASQGKGKERHSEENQPFSEQIICKIPKFLVHHPYGSLGFQAIKKTIESGRLLELYGKDAALREIDGAINYLATMKILIKEDY